MHNLDRAALLAAVGVQPGAVVLVRVVREQGQVERGPPEPSRERQAPVQAVRQEGALPVVRLPCRPVADCRQRVLDYRPVSFAPCHSLRARAWPWTQAPPLAMVFPLVRKSLNQRLGARRFLPLMFAMARVLQSMAYRSQRPRISRTPPAQ